MLSVVLSLEPQEPRECARAPVTAPVAKAESSGSISSSHPSDPEQFSLLPRDGVGGAMTLG